jgi:hypothetical protein
MGVSGRLWTAPGTGELDPAATVLPWDQVYALLAPHADFIRTLLTPTTSVPAYYRDLARQARQAGINDPEVLFALLWHAPQGRCQQIPKPVSLHQGAVGRGKTCC